MLGIQALVLLSLMASLVQSNPTFSLVNGLGGYPMPGFNGFMANNQKPLVVESLGYGGLGGASFNPGVAALPPAIAASIPGITGLGAGALGAILGLGGRGAVGRPTALGFNHYGINPRVIG